MVEFFTFVIVGGLLLAIAGFGIALMLAIIGILALPIVTLFDTFRNIEN